jgi:tetratricopeptide (TPR) repeat protein
MAWTIIAFLFNSLSWGLSVDLISADSTGPAVKTTYEERLTEGVDAFYRTDWVKATRVFEELKKEDPKDPMPHFFSSMMPFWEYFFIDQSQELADEFLKVSEVAVQLSRQKLNNTPSDTTMVLMLSGLYGYRSLVAAGESNYRVAIQSGLTGFNYTRQLLSIGTDRPDARIGRGMFYYMVGSIPSGMRWASNMVGIRGDIEQGFDELKKAAESESYVSNDAKMMLMYLYDKEERYDEALEYAGILTEAFPENVIFKFKKAQIFEKSGNNDLAASLYREVVEIDNPRLDKITGKSKSRLGEIEKLSLKH